MVAYGVGRLWLAPPEHLVPRKLELWQEGRSEKRLRDVRAMPASDLGPDRAYLETALHRRGLWRRPGSS